MKSSYLVGTLAFLAIVNLIAVDTYLYYQLFHRGSEVSARSAAAPGPQAAVAATGAVTKLDAAQRKVLGRIKKDFRDATGQTYGRVKELEDEMYRLVQQEPVDSAMIERNLEEHGRLRLELKRIAIAKMIEARSVLNAAQRDELFKAIFRTRPVPAASVATSDSGSAKGGRK